MRQKITFLKTTLVLAMFITSTTLMAQTLVAHYKFDNSLNDETTTYNLAASSGFTPTFETGHDATANGAVSGFTAADYLESAINFEIDANESRTMAAWIKVTTFSNGGLGVVGLGAPSTGTRWTFGTQGDKARIEIQGSGFNAVASPLTTGTWYHIAVVFNNSDNSAKLYVNGSYIDYRTWTNVNTTQTLLRVGNDYNVADPGPQTRGFQGAIDDLRIYTGAATDAQILSLYNNGTLAVNKVNKETFNAYPNPVKDRLYFSTNKIASVEIYNILGSKLATQKVDNGVDMSFLSKGIYLVKCQNSAGVNIATVKAIKK
ncbi:LamG-like jellyroll fold domain-containing protein [Mariniflexile sp.]|uniref:LamG-like jellyroll fold domain-containing protein n=1 Tax=Mariniflexile sp. TaxID=1979402 RepID=UPI00356843F8